MTSSYNRPLSNSPAFTAMSDAILGIAGELSLDAVLNRIVRSARQLVDARYAALGIPDDEGGFDQFITDGMTPQQWDAIGPFPRTHGLLGVMLNDSHPFRIRNIEQDPRFQGWPAHHPRMNSFLGVPILSKGKIIGAFYLTDKIDAGEFTRGDIYLIEILGAHAAVAIENAELYERSRELSMIEERNRLAREIHDTLAQGLTAIALQLETADALLDASADQDRIRKAVRSALTLTQANLDEARRSVLDLRAAPLEGRTLAEALYGLAKDSKYGNDLEILVEANGETQPLPPRIEMGLYRIAQEALTNVVRHADAKHVTVRLVMTANYARLFVEDDGRGFDPATVSQKHHGLLGLNERARLLGGTFRIESSEGIGTRVEVHVPLSSSVPRPDLDNTQSREDAS